MLLCHHFLIGHSPTVRTPTSPPWGNNAPPPPFPQTRCWPPWMTIDWICSLGNLISLQLLFHFTKLVPAYKGNRSISNMIVDNFTRTGWPPMSYWGAKIWRALSSCCLTGQLDWKERGSMVGQPHIFHTSSHLWPLYKGVWILPQFGVMFNGCPSLKVSVPVLNFFILEPVFSTGNG